MQIGTNQYYARAASAMSALSAQSDRLSTQISTGKRLQSAADSPVDYQRIATLSRAGADDTAYGANLTMAAGVLATTNTTLSSITTQLTRASELTVRAASGTMNDTDKAAIGEELSGIVETLTALANTKDARGQQIFGASGGDGDGPSVTLDGAGNATLATAPASAIPIGDDQSVVVGESATRAFAFTGADGNATNTFAVLAKLAAALKAGGDTGATTAGALTDLKSAATQATNVQTSLGARAARVDLEQTRLAGVATDRAATLSSLQDTDVTAAITELQKTMTILSATQASFTKLSSLSLFDYIK